MEDRPDLVPSSCADCQARVVSHTVNGVGVFWATHGETNAFGSGVEATAFLTQQHLESLTPTRHGLTTTGNSEFEVEGLPS